MGGELGEQTASGEQQINVTCNFSELNFLDCAPSRWSKVHLSHLGIADVCLEVYLVGGILTHSSL